MYFRYHEAFNVYWYQCPANNYITHYHVLEPITVNLKLRHRNSSTSAESTQHKCTSLWLTLPKHQQLCTQNKHWGWHLNVQYKASESACEAVITYLCYDSKHKQLHRHYCLRSLQWTPKVGIGQYPLGRYYSWPLLHTGNFKSVNLIDHVSIKVGLRIQRNWGCGLSWNMNY